MLDSVGACFSRLRPRRTARSATESAYSRSVSSRKCRRRYELVIAPTPSTFDKQWPPTTPNCVIDVRWQPTVACPVSTRLASSRSAIISWPSSYRHRRVLAQLRPCRFEPLAQVGCRTNSGPHGGEGSFALLRQHGRFETSTLRIGEDPLWSSGVSWAQRVIDEFADIGETS